MFAASCEFFPSQNTSRIAFFDNLSSCRLEPISVVEAGAIDTLQPSENDRKMNKNIENKTNLKINT